MNRNILLIFIVVLNSFLVFSQGKNQHIDLVFNNNNWISSSENVLLTTQGVSVDGDQSKAILITKEIPVNCGISKSFIAVSFSCDGQGFNSNQINFSIRTKGMNDWNQWEHVLAAHEIPLQESTFYSQLLFFNSSIDQIQFKMELINNDTKKPFIESMSLNIFNPDIKDSVAVNTKQTNSYDSCYCSLPDFTNRAEWGCPDGINPSCLKPDYTNVSHLIVHHSATSNTNDNWPGVVLSFWNYHVLTLGWCDIGYNWLLDPEGNLYEGRGGGDNVRGAHFSCANSYTMGVCVIGNFTDITPTSLAKEKLIRLLSWKCCQKNLEPLTMNYHSPTELDLFSISGHRDANPSEASGACPHGTACPGDSFYPQLDEIRFSVDSLMNIANCGGIPAPVNDNCEEALALEYHSDCIFVEADIAGATPSSTTEPECSNYNGYPALEDVWFTFIADSTAMGIKVQASDMFDPVIALYSSCEGEELACADIGGGVGGMEFIDYYDLIVGETYYIRVYHFGQLSPLTSNFEICLSNPFRYPFAEFEASISHGSSPLSVNFSDLSVNEPSSWSWTFEGGDPETSDMQNPVDIVYGEPGVYDVKLWVSNENGENELLKEDYIEVTISGVSSLEKSSIQIFPNPTNGLLNISSTSRINSIEIIDQYGQIVRRFIQPAKTITTNLSEFSDGVFLIKVDVNNRIYTHKIIKK